LLQLQTGQLLVGGQHQQAQLLGQARAIHSSRRRRSVVAEQMASAILR
jgi:hypothetical protein